MPPVRPRGRRRRPAQLAGRSRQARHRLAQVTTLSARAGLAARWERGGTRRYFEQLEESWADLRAEAEEYRELGDRVVAVGRMRGTGQASHVEIVRIFATVFVVRNSRFLRVDTYDDPRTALEAAGISE